MSLTPRFSAQKFTSVLSRAMGTGAGGVQKALTHIGAQKSLQSGVTVQDARRVMQKLKSSGAITDERGASDAFKRAERVANFASRMQKQNMRDERLATYRAERSLADDIVARNAHSVSAHGDSSAGKHATSITDAIKKKSGASAMFGPPKMSSGPVQLVKQINLPHAPLQDIPFD